MAAVFVTGGSGFVGGRLIERLVAEGNSVRALARSRASAEAVQARGAEPVAGDLGDVSARFVWGAGDTTLLPAIAGAVRAGRFAWIGGGRHRTSVTHVDNVVEGLMLGAQRGRSGGVYFVTDGDPVEFRAFVSELLLTQ